MESRDITITSKNQITLPAHFVRKMHLDRNRVIHAEIRDGSIVLTPQPTLASSMQRYWGKHHAGQPLTEDELKEAIRSSATDRLTKSI